MINQRAVEALFQQFTEKRLLVLGDLMVDAYITGTVERISPEAPVPVLVSEQRFSVPGGAANVANNLKAWGASTILIGVVGEDQHGQQLCRQLGQTGIDVSRVVTDGSRPTTVKTRVVAGNQQIVRVDTECSEDISDDIESRLIDATLGAFPTVDAVLLSDYQKGVLTPQVVGTVIKAARQAGLPVICNPKPPLMPFLQQATLVSVNIHEARAYAKVAHCAMPLETPEQLLAATSQWLEPLDVEYVMVTLGRHGCLLSSRENNLHVPAYSVDVSDPAGAGDTVISMLALCMVCGVSSQQAMMFANAAAGSVVRHVGVVTPVKDEVMQLLCHGEEESA